MWRRHLEHSTSRMQDSYIQESRTSENVIWDIVAGRCFVRVLLWRIVCGVFVWDTWPFWVIRGDRLGRVGRNHGTFEMFTRSNFSTFEMLSHQCLVGGKLVPRLVVGCSGDRQAECRQTPDTAVKVRWYLVVRLVRWTSLHSFGSTMDGI